MLAFSQTFFKGFSLDLTTPLDPSNIAMLDRSSGIRWPYYQEGQTCLHIGHALLYTTFDR